MTTTAPAPVAAPPRSFVGPGLIVAALVLAGFAWFWFQPSAADEARLAALETDPTLVLPALAGEMPELVETRSSVATRDWTGAWSVNEHIDRYTLLSRRVDQYAFDLMEHVRASPWSLVDVRCQEDQVVIAARRVIDDDWATLEFSAWAEGANGRLSVRSAISAVGGSDLVVTDAPAEVRFDCDLG